MEELRGENLMIKQVLRLIASDPKAKRLQAIGDTYKRIVSWDREDAADAKNATNAEDATYADDSGRSRTGGGRKRDEEGVKEKGGEPPESSARGTRSCSALSGFLPPGISPRNKSRDALFVAPPLPAHPLAAAVRGDQQQEEQQQEEQQQQQQQQQQQHQQQQNEEQQEPRRQQKETPKRPPGRFFRKSPPQKPSAVKDFVARTRHRDSTSLDSFGVDSPC